jgi:hypothetical protein
MSRKFKRSTGRWKLKTNGRRWWGETGNWLRSCFLFHSEWACLRKRNLGNHLMLKRGSDSNLKGKRLKITLNFKLRENKLKRDLKLILRRKGNGLKVSCGSKSSKKHWPQESSFRVKLARTAEGY